MDILSESGGVDRSRIARQKMIEKGIYVLLLLAAVSSIVITVGIMQVLIVDTYEFFKDLPQKFAEQAQVFAEQGNEELANLFKNLNPFLEFFTGTEWTPLFSPARFGILPLLSGTLVTSTVALCLAIPFGTSISLYLSEFANAKLRETLKPILELIAGVPSVVFGYFALGFVNPIVQDIAEVFGYQLAGANMLGAGLVIGISIIPLISSVSEDAMRAVPVQMREGSYAMGATRMQTAFKVVIPAAFSGIIAAYILGISRAVGETMISAIAAGLQPNFTWNPLEPAATVSAFIVQVTLGDLEFGSIQYLSVFAAGMMLAVTTLTLNVIGFFLIRKFRERY
jgi:phosphate transport system permease protein